MKKRIETMGIALGLLLVGGCGTEAGQKAEPAREIVISEVVEQLKEVNPVVEERQLDDFAVENEMGLELTDLSEYEGVITNSQSDSALIFVAKAAEGKTREVKQALADYQESLTANDLYVEFADKLEKAKEARVLTYDDYIVFVIAGLDTDYTRVTDAIQEAFGE